MQGWRGLAILAALLPGPAGVANAEREAVLKQVDLPHTYYWRELYIPQLTTGPSSAVFTPDGKALIYSMGGSLWRQSGRGDCRREPQRFRADGRRVCAR